MALHSSSAPESSNLTVKSEGSFDGKNRLIVHTLSGAHHEAMVLATGETASPMGDNQDRVDSLRLQISMFYFAVYFDRAF